MWYPTLVPHLLFLAYVGSHISRTAPVEHAWSKKKWKKLPTTATVHTCIHLFSSGSTEFSLQSLNIIFNSMLEGSRLENTEQFQQKWSLKLSCSSHFLMQTAVIRTHIWCPLCETKLPHERFSSYYKMWESSRRVNTYHAKHCSV